MTHHDEVVATDRLRRALLAFQAARDLHLGAHRRLKALPQTEVEAFWDGPGRRVGETMHATATEVVAAFEALPGAGLVVDLGDRRLVTQAQRYLTECQSALKSDPLSASKIDPLWQPLGGLCR